MPDEKFTTDDVDTLQQLIDELRDEITMSSDKRAEDPEEVSEDDVETAAVLLSGLVPELYEPVVQRAADTVIHWEETPSGDLRKGMLKRVDEALLSRRVLQGPIPRLLWFERIQRKRSIQDLARAIDVDAGQLERAESGEESILACPPESLVKWIRNLAIPSKDALRTLYVSLSRPSAGPAMAGKEDRRPPTDEEREYLHRVSELLGETEPEN